MNIMLCGKKEDYLMTIDCIKAVVSDAEVVFCESNDDVLQKLIESSFDLAIVNFNGADGMETVITLRRQRPDLPVVWLSDDIGFATQSYRLGATYFHSKPLTRQIMYKALVCCGLAIMEVK